MSRTEVVKPGSRYRRALALKSGESVQRPEGKLTNMQRILMRRHL
ncbi:MAG: hypothetical protein ACRENI_05895 [Gemmatimonadaceae bacterium]